MRVLVSGAGIAGCTLAWHLGRLGAHVTVVEKAAALLPHGQNIDISDSARSVVERMGLTERVRKCNTSEKGTQFIDPDGRVFADFPLKEGSTISPTSEFEILRGDLVAILYDASLSTPNVRYLFDTTVQRVLSNDSHSVRVQLKHNSPPGEGEQREDELEADVLVAADGQWSNVRKLCFPAGSIQVVDKNLYCVYWTAPRVESDNDYWNIYQALGSRGISLRPDPYNTVRPAFTRMPCNEQQKQAWEKATRASRQEQQELVRREFADAGWLAPRLIDSMAAAPDFYFQAVQQIRMARWSTNRVVCLGDAGYAPTPLTGMGTSLAVQGAYVLAGELSELEEGEAPARAFDEYERVFKPFVEKVQQIPAIVPGVVHPVSAWKRWLLQVAIHSAATVMKWDWVGKWFAESDKQCGFPLPQYAKLELCTQADHSQQTESVQDKQQT